MKLIDRTIVVTGAGGRLGMAISKALLSKGANVVAVDLRVDSMTDLKEKNYGQLHKIVGDINNQDSITNIFATAINAFGKIDGAVNCAYPRNAQYGQEFLKVKLEDFCENISLNLGGYFLFMQQCAKYSLNEKLKFSLVNLSSIYGVIAPRFSIYEDTDMTMPVEYAAIKSGLQHLVAYTTAYMQNTSFRVNCISPGGIFADQPTTFVKKYKSRARSKGLLDPTDINGAILFLLSDDSQYICGQNIIVDDGFSLC